MKMIASLQARAAHLGCVGALLALGACDNGSTEKPIPGPTGGTPVAPAPEPVDLPPRPIVGLKQTVIAPFHSPWAMAFLPDGRLLVTDNETKTLSVVTQTGVISDVTGLPDRGGIYDVALSPNFTVDRTIYLTFPEPSPPGAPRNGPYASDPKMFSGVLALATARIEATGSQFALKDFKVLWRQSPDIVSGGEWGGRIAFSPDRRYVFVTAGDRSVYYPATALDNTLGKIIRLNLDGTVPPDNPFVNTPGAKPEIWSLGHRNPYGLVFAPDGRLWSTEHGPKGGDEFNLITPGANYGWPSVSYGNGYDDAPIPKPVPGDGFAASAYFWTPAIAPAGMIFYSGRVFADWRGDVLLTGLVSKALIRVRIDGDTAKEVQRFDMGGRVREIEQARDGSLWILVDSPDGKLVKLSPVF